MRHGGGAHSVGSLGKRNSLVPMRGRQELLQNLIEDGRLV